MSGFVLGMCIQAFNVCADLDSTTKYNCAFEATVYCNYATILEENRITDKLIKGNYNEKDRDISRKKHSK